MAKTNATLIWNIAELLRGLVQATRVVESITSTAIRNPTGIVLISATTTFGNYGIFPTTTVPAL
jgi:hypothetical protein